MCSFFESSYTNKNNKGIREKLFEYNHEEQDKRYWIFRERSATLVGADQDLDIVIVDVLYLILNWRERQRNL